MSDSSQIKHFEELLSVNPKINVLKHEFKPQEEPEGRFNGEVDITVEENGEENLLHAVAKFISPTELENSPIGFKNEIGFYQDIVPTIREFQQENGVPLSDYSPEFYGARLSLKPGDIIDSDAVILVQNLKPVGVEITDKKRGFDLHATKAILESLANFHATALALRKTRPEIFSSKILPHLHEHPSSNKPIDVDVILNGNPNTVSLVSKVKRALVKKRIKKIREPWATITHNQLWMNNIVVNKFVDWQMIDYGSPAIDVLFLLFTSVQISVLQYHFDKLLQHYFKEFINTLKQYSKIDITEYTYDHFKEELKIESSYQIYRALFTLIETLGETEKLANGIANGGGAKASRAPLIKFPLNLKERVWFIVEESFRQHWI